MGTAIFWLIFRLDILNSNTNGSLVTAKVKLINNDIDWSKIPSRIGPQSWKANAEFTIFENPF